MKTQNKKRYFVFSLLFSLFLAMVGYAKPVENKETIIIANFSQDTIMIGDQLRLRVTINKDIMVVTEFPEFKDGLGGVFSILNQSNIDTILQEGRNVTLRRDYLVTGFDAGYFNLGKFPVLNIKKNSTDTIFSQDSLRLFVNTFIIDTTKHQLLNVTPPIDAPLIFDEIKYWVYGGIVGLIVLVVLIYLIKKYYKNRKRKEAGVILLPPHIEAINELEKLYTLKLWRDGRHKIYHTKLSDIIRNYIHRRYNINAMEMTSEEIMSSLRSLDVNSSILNKLSDSMSLSDLVKFAKFAPEDEESEGSLSTAYEFVEQTKPIIIEIKSVDKSSEKEKKNEYED